MSPLVVVARKNKHCSTVFNGKLGNSIKANNLFFNV